MKFLKFFNSNWLSVYIAESENIFGWYVQMWDEKTVDLNNYQPSLELYGGTKHSA